MAEDCSASKVKATRRTDSSQRRWAPTGSGVPRYDGGGRNGHSLAVTEDGALWTWGCVFHGCLGHNDETERSVPEKLARQLFGDSSVVLVSAGAAHTLAVTLDGALWAWGNGKFGRLGVGDVCSRLIPVRVGVDDAFVGSGVLMVTLSRDELTWAPFKKSSPSKSPS